MDTRNRIEQLIAKHGESAALAKLLELQAGSLIERIDAKVSVMDLTAYMTDHRVQNAIGELPEHARQHVLQYARDRISGLDWLTGEEKTRVVLMDAGQETAGLQTPARGTNAAGGAATQSGGTKPAVGAEQERPGREWTAEEVHGETRKHIAHVDALNHVDDIVNYRDGMNNLDLPRAVLVEVDRHIETRVERLNAERQQQGKQLTNEPEAPQKLTFSSEDARANAVNGHLSALRSAKTLADFDKAADAAKAFISEYDLPDEDASGLEHVIGSRRKLIAKKEEK